MKNEERYIDFDYLKKRDYVIKNLLDNDAWYTLLDSKNIRKYVNRFYKIFKNIEEKKEIK